MIDNWQRVPDTSVTVEIQDPTVSEIINLVEQLCVESDANAYPVLSALLQQGWLKPASIGVAAKELRALAPQLNSFIRCDDWSALRTNDLLKTWEVLKQTSPFFTLLEKSISNFTTLMNLAAQVGVSSSTEPKSTQSD